MTPPAPSTAPPPATPRIRVRLRFGKDGDLRWISHRDLLRAFERLFRRTEVKLSMSQGFHPKPRLSFPTALALGVRGLDEVMEVELAEPVRADRLIARLRAQAPPGLTLHGLQVLDGAHAKARPVRLSYRFPVPAQRRDEVGRRLTRLRGDQAVPVPRAGRDRPLDARAGLEKIELQGDELVFHLQVLPQGGVRPRELLQVLGLDDLEQQGAVLTRTAVELAS